MCFSKSKKLSKFIGNAPKQRLNYFDLYNLKINNISVNLYISKKRATKATHIHCAESGDIIWEQFYPFGGMSIPAREKKYVLNPACEKIVLRLWLLEEDCTIFRVWMITFSHLATIVPTYIKYL